MAEHSVISKNLRLKYVCPFKRKILHRRNLPDKAKKGIAHAENGEDYAWFVCRIQLISGNGVATTAFFHKEIYLP